MAESPTKPTVAELQWSGSPQHSQTVVLGIASTCFWISICVRRSQRHHELPVQEDSDGYAGSVSQAPWHCVLKLVSFSPCVIPEKQNKTKTHLKSHKSKLHLVALLIWNHSCPVSISLFIQGLAQTCLHKAYSHLANTSGSQPYLQLSSKQL